MLPAFAQLTRRSSAPPVKAMSRAESRLPVSRRTSEPAHGPRQYVVVTNSLISFFSSHEIPHLRFENVFKKA
jgi:hypothetical protein